jgi:putative flavoprotein involved in K+ transport
MDTMKLDVLVIGAGQAGLAAGQAIQESGLNARFLLIDRHARVGDSWRKRYKSLVLFTPRAYSALPGLNLSGDPDGFASKDEIAGYLEGYARHFELPVRQLITVRSLEKTAEGFRAITSSGLYLDSKAVILANGAFQKPTIPNLAVGLSPEVAQLNAVTYQAPDTLPPGPVLVVGDGATGRQLALEIVDRQPVILAAGSRRRPQPQKILGLDLFWWADHLGLLNAPYNSPIGNYLLRGDTFPGKHLNLDWLAKRGVRVENRLVALKGQLATFKDGSRAEVATVIWSTGYEEDDSFVNIPQAKNDNGSIMHYRGITPVPGMFVLGRSWQWTRGSALLHGVGKDADFLVKVLEHYLSEHQAQPYSIGKAADVVR